jgi:2-keto-4-pentenoate hydratase/2-oxohepta-3-ene-1,7-dioic acid hydratase in catechol pathway
MRFATIDVNGSEQGALRVGQRWVPLNLVDEGLTGDLLALIARGLSRDGLSDLAAAARAVPVDRCPGVDDVRYRPPYRHPRKIWGIGLNYSAHAGDLHESAPDQPASFIKGDHTIIGPGDDIVLPPQSQRVTAEAELGIVMGAVPAAVAPEQALDHVFGVCTILDQTAEDILALNPRYLTRSKNFPTFFSFGPEIVTLDEFLDGRELADVRVTTVLDGAVVRENDVRHMTHSPQDLISFHSRMMPWFPGDILSTGTPGAGVLAPGAVAEARVDGLAPLVNAVTSAPGAPRDGDA